MILVSNLAAVEDLRRKKLISIYEADRIVAEIMKVFWPNHNDFKWDDRQQRYTRRNGNPIQPG